MNIQKNFHLNKIKLTVDYLCAVKTEMNRIQFVQNQSVSRRFSPQTMYQVAKGAMSYRPLKQYIAQNN